MAYNIDTKCKQSNGNNKTSLDCQDTEKCLDREQYNPICEDISDDGTDLYTAIDSYDIIDFNNNNDKEMNTLVDNLIDDNSCVDGNQCVTMQCNNNIGGTFCDTYDMYIRLR